MEIERFTNTEEEMKSRNRRLKTYALYLENMTSQISREIIEQLIDERKKQNKTQQDIANITGLLSSNIARFEKSDRVPTLTVLEKYASALGKRIKITLEDEI